MSTATLSKRQTFCCYSGNTRNVLYLGKIGVAEVVQRYLPAEWYKRDTHEKKQFHSKNSPAVKAI